MADPARLSRSARRAVEGATDVFVSPVSCFEICQKVRVGKWPDMEPFVSDLPQLIEQQHARLAALTPEIATSAGSLTWSHRDPFDRILAATADEYDLALVSADAVFDSLGALRRIW